MTRFSSPFGPVSALVVQSLLLFSGSLEAQVEAVPVIQGEVRVGEVPLPGAMVVLHQVSSELSGEVDSVRAGPEGTFRLSV